MRILMTTVIRSAAALVLAATCAFAQADSEHVDPDQSRSDIDGEEVVIEHFGANRAEYEAGHEEADENEYTRREVEFGLSEKAAVVYARSAWGDEAAIGGPVPLTGIDGELFAELAGSSQQGLCVFGVFGFGAQQCQGAKGWHMGGGAIVE